MDPVTLTVLALVVGGSTAALSMGARLRRKVLPADIERLREHNLVRVHDDVGPRYSDAVPVLPALSARVSHSSDATGGLVIFVSAPSTWATLKTRLLWARRDDDVTDDWLAEAPLMNGFGPARGTVVRWRRVGAGCFMGALPPASLDSLADDREIQRALTTLLLAQQGELATSGEELLFRYQRPATASAEAEVRRCLDFSRAVIAALDAVAVRLPDLDDDDAALKLQEKAVASTSGSPFAVRSVDPLAPGRRP
jgi:hypothetical protein